MGPWHRNYLGIFYTVTSQNIKAKLGFSCSFFFLRNAWLCPMCCTGTWVPWEKGGFRPQGGRGCCPGKWVSWLWTLRGGEPCLLWARLLCSVPAVHFWDSDADWPDVEFSTPQQWSAGWVSSHPHCEPSFLERESPAAAEFLLVRRWCYAFRKLCIPTQEQQLVLDSRRHAKLLPKI